MTDASKAGQQDQSMEDILQSIKRIIAEEGDVKPQPGSANGDAMAAPFVSDVLELTDMVPDEAAPMTAPAAAMDPIDAIFAAPTEGGFTAPAFATWSDEPEPAEPMPEEPVEKAPIAIIPAEGGMSSADEGILSEISVAASAAALKTLVKSSESKSEPMRTVSSPAFRNGLTVEDLVVEALRPMLKEWLDANLPHVVDRKVAQEIERISKAMQS